MNINLECHPQNIDYLSWDRWEYLNKSKPLWWDENRVSAGQTVDKWSRKYNDDPLDNNRYDTLALEEN